MKIGDTSTCPVEKKHGTIPAIVRLAWVFPAAYLPRLVSSRLRSRDPYPEWHQVAIVAWIGMRGGLSLAAALALPFTLTGGLLFPQRDLVIFFTFGVILATLVGQGLSLVPIIRLLGIERDGALEREHAQAHLVAARAALSRLDELATEAGEGRKTRSPICVPTMRTNWRPSLKRSMAPAINALTGMCRSSSSFDKRCSQPNGRR